MLEEVMKRHAPPITDPVELIVAPAAIERALDVYQQLKQEKFSHNIFSEWSIRVS
jgi:hypothetical protein